MGLLGGKPLFCGAYLIEQMFNSCFQICLQVFTKDELQMVADLCIKYDVIVISDEVYEWLIYDDNKHLKIGKSETVCSFPNEILAYDRIK